MQEYFRKSRKHWKSNKKIKTLSEQIAAHAARIVLEEQSKNKIEDASTQGADTGKREDIVYGMSAEDAERMKAAFPKEISDRVLRLKWWWGKK